ncbi:EAL domain-containing protein [Paenibacillus sepulcri]|uniref:EAL domain-containing protein n=1 Tax=Paenibacillus sepulcri TaxID=359917 RepID=A0ABS7C4B1_9BACL|nr:EAL domain-containing protein [Paenibacillus sepulcri]
MNHMHGSFHESLVILSCLIAVASSYSALDLTGKIYTSKDKLRLLWLVCGAFSMGLGIWSMHFVGMLAMRLPIRISYDIKLVLLSVVLAIGVSLIALFTAHLQRMGWKEIWLSGGLMAAGICGMHYIGMAAMTVDISYDPWMVVLSVIIAVTASAAALGMLYYFRQQTVRYALLFKLGSSLVMGGGIAGMHYTGMAGAYFHERMDNIAAGGMLIDQTLLAYIIAAGTFLLLGLTFLGILVNKRFRQKDLTILESEQWYRSLYENNADGILSVNTKGEVMGMNPAVSKIAGAVIEGFTNKHISAIGLKAVEEQKARDKALSGQPAGERPDSYETVITNSNGHQVEIHVTEVPVIIDERIVGSHVILRDITEEKRDKSLIEHLAFHDELTALPNRRLFNQMLDQAIEECKKRSGSFTVLVLDVDRFKLINDSLGHTYGDLFLKALSERFIAGADNLEVTIARMGGDEFSIICRSETDQAADLLATRILSLLRQPFHLKGNDFYISASIGIASFPEHGESGEELLRLADAAMYEVKKHGKNGYRYYSQELDKHLMDRIELEGELRKAIERRELLVYYQPQIRTEDSRMIGVEALVRWNHSSKGLMMPGSFIPIAEETGMIHEIGTWVLYEACRQMVEWHEHGGPLIPVSVNLSARQFHQANLVEYIEAVLAETGLEPKYLELEITESMMMDPIVSIDILNKLNMLGVRISLDDFGTGYSSLSYLKTFPIHKLKIDRSFISEITENDNDKAIVATIISMAHHLNLDVVAEGIETKDQLDILTHNQCKEIQGYFFSRPLSAHQVEKEFFVPLRF